MPPPAWLGIDRPAAEHFGLSPGTLLRVEVAGLTLEAVYVGEADPATVRTSWLWTVRGDRTEFGAAFRPTHDPASLPSLAIRRIVAGTDFPLLKKRISTTVTVLDERFTVPGGPPTAQEELDDVDLSGLE